MDNFIKLQNNKDPINDYCNKNITTKKTNCNKQILYTPINTEGNKPIKVKSMLYSQYVKRHTK